MRYLSAFAVLGLAVAGAWAAQPARVDGIQAEPLSDLVVALLDPQALPRDARRVEAGPVPCRTVLMREALRAPELLSPQAQALLAAHVGRPPSSLDVVPAGERVFVHGPSAELAALAREVRASLALIQSQLAAPSFPHAPLDIYLQDVTGGVSSVLWDGFVNPRPVGVAISPSLSAAERRVELYHQLVHVWQLSSPRGAAVPPSWFEGIAVYVAAREAPVPAQALASAIAPALAARENARDVLVPELLRSRASLPAFLAEASGLGPGAIRLLYENLALGWEPALDRTLATLGLGSTAGLDLELAIWLAITGPEDNGNYFSFAAELPAASPRDLVAAVPSMLHVGAHGHALLRIEPLATDGGYWISIRTDGPRQGVRGAIVVRRRDAEGAGRSARLHVAPIPRLTDGSLRIGVPVRSTDEVLVVLAESSGVESEFTVTADHDPVFPYVLSSFTTEPAGNGVLVRWTVSEEQGIAGWRILRSIDPASGFVPVSPILIPGRGDASDPLTYYYLDDTVTPDVRYFYVLEGRSVYGFAQPSFMVSVTAPPRASR